MIDAEILRTLLHYDPDTGVFTWRVSRYGGARAGNIAGSLRKTGYRGIKVCGKLYYEHRLAWLYVYGEWPSNFIDHINCIEDDNRIANLRLANNWQNKANSRKHKAGLPKGVKKCHYRYLARIRVDKTEKYLGVYDTPEQAHAAYCEAAQKEFGAYYRAG